MYDRELIVAELIRREMEIKAMLRVLEAHGDAQRAKTFYQRLGTLTGIAKRVWGNCEQSQYYAPSNVLNTTTLRTGP